MSPEPKEKFRNNTLRILEQSFRDRAKKEYDKEPASMTPYRTANRAAELINKGTEMARASPETMFTDLHMHRLGLLTWRYAELMHYEPTSNDVKYIAWFIEMMDRAPSDIQ